MTVKRDKNFALLYGIMLGDGCLSYCSKRQDYAMCISGSYYHDQDFFKSIVKPVIDKLRKKPVKIRARPEAGCLRIDISDKRFFKNFSSLGFPIGKKGVKLSIPKIFLMDSNLMKRIIAGLFATDGCLVLAKNPNKYYARIEFISISKKLLTQVNNHLRSLGFNSTLSLRERKPTFSTEKDVYKIQINGLKNLLLFKRKIGFVNLKHHKKYTLFLDYCKRYDKAIKNIPNQKQKFYRIESLTASGEI